MGEMMEQRYPTTEQTMSPDLWSSRTCAQYLGCSMRHFRDRIAAKPHFPAALRLDNMQRLYWRAEEVRAWVNKNLRPVR